MGVIAQLGKGVKEQCPDLKPGMRVVPDFLDPTSPRSYQDYVAVNCSRVVKVPAGVSDLSASQLMVNPLTVMGMIETLVPVDPADKSKVYLLQAAGGSTLGKQFIQLAKHLGYKTISTVRRCEQVEELIKFGADHVICTETHKVQAEVLRITEGFGAWGAVDPIGADMTSHLQDSVKAGGKVLIYGALGGLEYRGSTVSSLFRYASCTLLGEHSQQHNCCAEFSSIMPPHELRSPLPCICRYVNVEGFWGYAWWQTLPEAQRKERMEGMLAMMDAKIVTTHNGKTYDLADIELALQVTTTWHV